MQLEVVPTWEIGDEEVLLYVMSGGVNYDGVWAALGQPVSVLDFHGSAITSPDPTRRALV